MERLRFEKGKAAFTLKDRLQRHRVSHPNNALSIPGQQDEVEEDDDLEETNTWFESDDNGHIHVFSDPNPGSVGVSDSDIPSSSSPPIIPCEAVKSNEGNRKMKAQFGRRRTHNEQTMVRPCGIICARATFYGAEAVSNVLVSVNTIII